jgi:hypothetical protein
MQHKRRKIPQISSSLKHFFSHLAMTDPEPGNYSRFSAQILCVSLSGNILLASSRKICHDCHQDFPKSPNMTISQ